MSEQLERTERLIGKEAIQKLKQAKVAVFGLGGVGSYVVEGLVRAGIENFILVDHDVVATSNLNRQIIATEKTIGRPKVEVGKERILEINSNAKVEIYQEFFMPETTGNLDESISYVIDAIDTVTAKIELVMRAQSMQIPIISCMGTGNKLDATKFAITDIYKTSVCPLAKVMRKELKARGVKKLKVLYSTEEPINVQTQEEKKEVQEEIIENQSNETSKKYQKPVPGSISFVPSVAGLLIAGEVIKDIIS